MAKDRAAGWAYIRSFGDVVKTADGAWVLTSPEAVKFAHGHPELFSSARAFDSLASPVPLIPIAIDPPRHTSYRRVLDPMLAPKVINQLQDELRAQARELIGRFAGRGQCDAVGELARLYPTQVFLTLFGMPLEDRDQFIYWAETIIEHSNRNSQVDPSADVIESATALFEYLQRYVEKKRTSPEGDILSRVLARTGAEAWSDDEVLGMCFLFVLAGLDTVTAMIGFTLLHLARDADLRRRLVSEPDLVGPVIEEVLRIEPAAPLTPRVTTEDVEVCGTVIPGGSSVVLCLGTVNRDPGQFPQADTIDPAHADTGHRAFGGGIHRCLGSHLARRELRLVVEEFHKLIPDYVLAPGAEPEVVWPSGTFHLKSLPLVFSAANG
jgi:cytochrome P450